MRAPVYLTLLAAVFLTTAQAAPNERRPSPARSLRDLMREAREHAVRHAKTRDARALEDALAAYIRAASMAPRHRAAAPLLARARLLLEHRRDKAEAHAALQELVRHYPRAPEARTGRHLLALLKAFDPTRLARRVTAVREELGPASTRIILDLDGTIRQLPAPLAAAPLDRIRVRLPGLRARRELLTTLRGHGLASHITLRKFRGGLLLDATARQLVRARVFHVTEPNRLVVDLGIPEPSAAAAASAASPRANVGATAPSPPPLGRLLRRVVIDPGHGGKDPGALGRRTRLKEKDVTLQIAHKLGALLRQVGVETILTRDGDETLSLPERTDLANSKGADLFLSIHVNSNPNPERHGIETYYLDTTRDRYSQRLAEQENRAGGEIGDLEFIIADLLTKTNVASSAQLAGQVLRATVEHLSGRYPGIVGHGVKPALFYVLLGAKMPAILVESSYLTNASDEGRLRDEACLQRIAEGIFLGIRRFAVGSALAAVSGR
jgi:N-acetylmuramoyl-L-alanine amidase